MSREGDGGRPAGGLRRLLRPSPFSAGLAVILLASLLYLSFGVRKPPLLTALDNQLTSAMFRWRGPQPIDSRIVIVDIDEASLSRIGQWPWPRDRVAALVAAIGEQGARVVGLDMLFVEPDRTSPKHLAASWETAQLDPELAAALRRWAEQPVGDHDRLLGEALAKIPSVLGYSMIFRQDGLAGPEGRPFPSARLLLRPASLAFDRLLLRPAYRATPLVPEVARATSEGFINVFPDDSGAVLKVPLLLALDGVPYPSLALEVARVGLGASTLTLHGATTAKAGRHGLLGVSLGERFVPTDERGELAVNFRGPYGSYPCLPAADLLDGSTYPELEGAYVLIGSSAAGLLDLQSTPFSAIIPGVEIHANVIDNLLQGDPLAYDRLSEIGMTFCLILFGGVLLAAVLAFGRPLPGAVAALLLIGAAVAVNYQLLFLRGTLIGLTYPLATLIVLCLVVTLMNLLLADREKRFIQGAFRHYLAPQVISQMVEHPERLSLAGEERVLSVLFSDVRDFTAIAERLDNVELAGFMNRYLSEMGRVITARQGLIDKFIGDAVMAIWGAPLEDADHPFHAVSAALAMRDRVAELAPVWSEAGLPAIRIGVGVNTGSMRVGNFGSDELFDYTVVGDQVNLASRIEGLNKLYGTTVLISAATRDAVCDRIVCRRIDLVRVKGKQQQVEICEPLAFGREADAEVRTWEEVIDLYRQRSFSVARKRLLELERERPNPLYRLYLQRIEQFRQVPPPADWDGCFIQLRK